MEKLEKPLKSYLRAVKRLLACPKSYRSGFLADMEKDIRQFLLENDSASYSDVVGNFGTPEELAKLYLENVPPEELAAYAAKKKRSFRIVSVFLILLVSVTILTLYTLLQEAREIDFIYVEETIRVIE